MRTIKNTLMLFAAIAAVGCSEYKGYDLSYRFSIEDVYSELETVNLYKSSLGISLGDTIFTHGKYNYIVSQSTYYPNANGFRFDPIVPDGTDDYVDSYDFYVSKARNTLSVDMNIDSEESFRIKYRGKYVRILKTIKSNYTKEEYAMRIFPRYPYHKTTKGYGVYANEQDKIEINEYNDEVIYVRSLLNEVEIEPVYEESKSTTDCYFLINMLWDDIDMDDFLKELGYKSGTSYYNELIPIYTTGSIR